MSRQVSQYHCDTCDAPRLFEREVPSQLAHAALTLFTCGLWLPVWFGASVIDKCTPYRCSRCGTKAAD